MPGKEMNHWERLTAAIAGAEVDRVPISLWRHFPHVDLTAAGLAEVMVNWQRTYDFDLVKFMPTGTYCVEDWGAKSAWLDSPIGSRNVVVPGVTKAEQWPGLAKLSPTEGRLGQEVEAVRLAAEALKGEVPILQTVFGPLTIASKLAGERAYADMREHPDLFEAGLAIIADAMIAFGRASLAAGAHGIFFSTQCASTRLMNEAEHLRFGAAYDRRVLQGLVGESRFTMLHLHGEDLMFDQLLELSRHHGELARPAERSWPGRDGRAVPRPAGRRGGRGSDAAERPCRGGQGRGARRHRADGRAAADDRAGLRDSDRHAGGALPRGGGGGAGAARIAEGDGAIRQRGTERCGGLRRRMAQGLIRPTSPLHGATRCEHGLAA